MTERFDGNPLGKALAWTCGGLAVALVALAVIWALPPAGSGGEESVGNRAVGNTVPQLVMAEPIEKYAVIVDRPVFNEGRQPVIGLADENADEEEAASIENVDAPEVELAGVVITPEVRVATLRLKDSPESLLAFEGQPLEGDFGSWHLSRIEPRLAILESDAGEQVELQLQIHDAMMKEPPKPAVDAGAQAPAEDGGQAEEAGDPNMTRAEEIRQRIQQRREELRRQQEEGDPQLQQQNQIPQVDYREAIQAMMAGRKNQEDDESKE